MKTLIDFVQLMVTRGIKWVKYLFVQVLALLKSPVRLSNNSESGTVPFYAVIIAMTIFVGAIASCAVLLIRSVAPTWVPAIAGLTVTVPFYFALRSLKADPKRVKPWLDLIWNFWSAFGAALLFRAAATADASKLDEVLTNFPRLGLAFLTVGISFTACFRVLVSALEICPSLLTIGAKDEKAKSNDDQSGAQVGG
jgi:hypothetical protein